MNRKWTLALAAVAATAFAGSAFTAPAIAAPAPFDWTGAYVGAHIGYGWSHEHWNQTFSSLALPLDASVSAVKPSGVAGGIQLGYDYQAGPWVIGAQGDFTYTDQKHASDHVVFTSYSGESDIDWNASLKVRSGWAFASSLLYVDGGVAFAHEKTLIMFQGAQTTNRVDHTRTGWTLGGGLETGFATNWSVGVDYAYMDFGKDHNVYTYTDHPAGLIEDWDLTTHSQAVTVRVNYRFH